MPTLGDEDIGRLDVTVDDALRMCGIHGIGNFDSERQHHLDVQWFAGDPVLQCHAIQKLHGNESLTIFLTDVVNRANILMIQSRRRLRLALEAGQCLRVSGNLLRQKLESDETVEPGVLSLIDNTHPAATQLIDDAVVRDRLSDKLRRGHCLNVRLESLARSTPPFIAAITAAAPSGAAGRRSGGRNEMALRRGRF